MSTSGSPRTRQPENCDGSAYAQPLYYEIAFGFVDVRRQVRLLKRFARRFGRRSVTTVLDICCGPSLQLRELARRGCVCIGLDQSREMLDYLKSKDTRIRTVQAELASFRLREQVDLAMIMMGSLLVGSNEELLSHLDSVARCLAPGGLYLIENARLDWLRVDTPTTERWTMQRDGVRVAATYDGRLVDVFQQLFLEWLILDVNEAGRRAVYRDERIVKTVFPQEFVALVRCQGDFELIGYFEEDSTRRLKRAGNANLLVLRRKARTTKAGRGR